MRQTKQKNRNKALLPNELLKIIGQGVEEICQRQAAGNMDNSNSVVASKEGAGELIKLLQLLEKYVSLCEKMAPEKEKETLAIDYSLLRDYLNRKFDERF